MPSAALAPWYGLHLSRIRPAAGVLRRGLSRDRTSVRIAVGGPPSLVPALFPDWACRYAEELR